MNGILWTSQILLAVTFLYSGINKSFLSEKQLIAKGQTGVVGLAPATIHFIGISEILGVIGLILPWWLGILPVLTPLAAGCFAVIMIIAAPIHHRLREPKNVAINLTLLALSLFVAIGRAMEV
jgi:uncharacterized membrane protein YphA (DoxX/SURF4 family)